MNPRLSSPQSRGLALIGCIMVAGSLILHWVTSLPLYASLIIAMVLTVLLMLVTILLLRLHPKFREAALNIQNQQRAGLTPQQREDYDDAADYLRTHHLPRTYRWLSVATYLMLVVALLCAGCALILSEDEDAAWDTWALGHV